MYKAIIFDCFGVLITDYLQNLITKRVSDPEVIENIVSLVSASHKGAIEAETFNSEMASLLNLDRDEYSNEISKGEVKNEQLMSYIRELRKDYRTGFLSNISSIEGVYRRFTKEELSDHFDAVVASAAIGFAKPEAQAYQITADRLGVRLDECVMIDDRLEYVEGAVSSGMKGIKYLTFEQMKTELEELLVS